MKLIFCPQMNTKVCYKTIISLWAYIARYARSTQNNKFAISLQYLQKCIGEEVEFLPSDKYESLLQDDIFTLSVCSQTRSKYPKQQICNIFAISQGKHEG